MIWPFRLKKSQEQPPPLLHPSTGWRVEHHAPPQPPQPDLYWRQGGGWGSRSEDEGAARSERLRAEHRAAERAARAAQQAVDAENRPGPRQHPLDEVGNLPPEVRRKLQQ